ncbi:uncharacterized protein [Ptychodera flava]|uniref:uncharacterized protein isoform X1 n=1 Tax=Ptychodera flava TaxID=63121 RepID=UPI00396A41D8
MIDGIFNDANIVLRKAESQIGFTKYSSERNNDEHFVNWCKTETGHRERVNKMSDIKLGDHIIYVGALSIDYHYLALKNGKDSCDTVRVIQYKVNKVVEEDVKLSTNGGRLYRFVDDDDDLIEHDVEEIISQAKRQLGEKQYCDEANDNEHFVYWCKTRAEHRERVSNLEQLRDGDHLIIKKYRGLKEHHSLVVENEFREKEIIYYDSNMVSKDRLSVDPSKEYVYRSYRNPYDTAHLLRKDKFGQKARGEVGKSFYCIGNNENRHFVKWCMVNTEIIEEVNKIEEIITDDWFILFDRSKEEHQLYLATGNGHTNKIDAINMSYYLQSPSTNKTISVHVNPTDQIFRILYCFEEDPISDMRYNFESNMKNGQSVYGSLFVEMMHLMRPDPTRVKPVTRAADIRKGDHLMQCRFGGLYYHHLLAVENGSCSNKIKVIHFSKSRAEELRSKIKEEEVEIDSKTGHCFIILYDVCDDTDTVVKRARQRIGEKGYSLENNNCEHFVTKCKIGSKQCDQLNYGGRRVLAALAEQSIDVSKQQFIDAPLKTSAAIVAEAALLRIVMRAAARGLSPTATGIRTVVASSSIAAGVAVLSESAFLTHDAIKVERKLNQVRNTKKEKHDIFTWQWQIGGAFVGGVGGTIGGGVVGQILIPVPVLGFAVGSVVGGLVGKLTAMGAGTGIGHAAYKSKGIDVYMDFLCSVRRNKILNQ